MYIVALTIVKYSQVLNLYYIYIGVKVNERASKYGGNANAGLINVCCKCKKTVYKAEEVI